MVWTRSPVYFYQRNDIYYFSRAVPKDLQARFNKRRVEVSLKTKSADKARSLSMTLSDRLERYWDSLRLEQIHSRELGLSLINAYILVTAILLISLRAEKITVRSSLTS